MLQEELHTRPAPGRGLAEEVAGMAAHDAMERMAERLDDIRGSMTTFAIEQARQSGKLEAMETQITGLQATFSDVNTLRENVARLQEQVGSLKAKEFRGWIESVLKAAIGGGLVLGAQHFLR